MAGDYPGLANCCPWSIRSNWTAWNVGQLRVLASELLDQIARHDASIASKDQEIERKYGELKYRQAKIDRKRLGTAP